LLVEIDAATIAGSSAATQLHAGQAASAPRDFGERENGVDRRYNFGA